MLTDTEVLAIIGKTELTDVEQLETIRKYIYDRKGVDVGNIERPSGRICMSFLHGLINYFRNPMVGIHHAQDFQCMEYMYFYACKYYYNKFKKDDKD